MRDSEIERLIRLNTISPLILTKYVARMMMSERNGRQYQAWSNSLTRVLNQIGFKAVADKPPALQDYLAARSAQAPAAA
jgi:hypothetical protein